MNKRAFTKPTIIVKQVVMDDIICTSPNLQSTYASESDDTGNFMLGRGDDGWDED